MNIEQDFEYDFKNELGDQRWPDINHVLDLFFDGYTPSEHNGLSIYYDTEKIHALQENVCMTISCDEFEIELIIENGINNGTQLNDYQINPKKSFTKAKRYHEVITGVKPDYERMLRDLYGRNITRQKAAAMIKAHESEIMRLSKNQAYDNYATGGGNNQTNRYYSDKVKELNNKGIYWVFETEEIEADSNWK